MLFENVKVGDLVWEYDNNGVLVGNAIVKKVNEKSFCTQWDRHSKSDGKVMGPTMFSVIRVEPWDRKSAEKYAKSFDWKKLSGEELFSIVDVLKAADSKESP